MAEIILGNEVSLALEKLQSNFNRDPKLAARQIEEFERAAQQSLVNADKQVRLLREAVKLINDQIGDGPGPGGVTSVHTRVGDVVSAFGDYTSDETENVSGVPGVTVSDALDSLDGAIPPPAPITSVFGRLGAILAVLGDYTSTLITNLSGVAGASVTDALNNLNGAIPPPAPVDSVHTRVGAVVSADDDYTASQVTNVPAGNITAVNVQDALNELDADTVDGTAARVVKAQLDVGFTSSGGDVPFDILSTTFNSDAATFTVNAASITVLKTGYYQFHVSLLYTQTSVTDNLAFNTKISVAGVRVQQVRATRWTTDNTRITAARSSGLFFALANDVIEYESESTGSVTVAGSDSSNFFQLNYLGVAP